MSSSKFSLVSSSTVDEDDPRLDFIFRYLDRSLKIKMDKWNKMMASEEFKLLIMDFFLNEEMMMIIISISTNGQLNVSDTFPAATKHKFCYFMKKEPTLIKKDDEMFKSKLVYGDLSPKPLENLVTFIEEAANPIVNSDVNQEKWPETVVVDVKQYTQDICASLYSVQGQLKGKTLLSLPLYVDAIQDNEQKVLNGQMDDLDIDLITQIENIVAKWSEQIEQVLKQDSAKALEGSYPNPWTEIHFWENRVADLKSIYEQMNHKNVRSIAIILEKTESTHWPTFKIMFRNIIASLAEAEDILVHLKPLKKHLEVIQNSHFEDLKTLIKPMMHCLCLIWSHSRYYCSAQRIIVLLQEICNFFIDLSRHYLGSSTLLTLEPQEGQAKINVAVSNLQFFRDSYNEHRTKLPVYFEPDVEPKNWDFLPTLVFKRFDKYLNRLKKLKEYFDTSVEFYKLDRIEIGGSLGRELSGKVYTISKEYINFYQKFGRINYDFLNPEDDRFDKDIVEFEKTVLDIDERLSAIATNGFNDGHTPESKYKLIMVHGQLLERPAIKKDFEPKYNDYAKTLEKDLDKIKELYDEHMAAFDDPRERTMVHKDFPPYSASVHWVKEIQSRLKTNMDQFKSLDAPISTQTELLKEKHEELNEILEQFLAKTIEGWKAQVANESAGYIDVNLFKRENQGRIYVNFNPELTSTLKEVKYMKMAGIEDIPAEAQALYDQREDFRKKLNDLDLIARLYNNIHNDANDYELALMQNRIDNINEMLVEGEHNLKWSDPDITDYIEKLKGPMIELESNLQKAQDNTATIRRLVNSWLSRPLFERKEGMKNKQLDLDESAMQRKQEQYNQISEVSTQIKELVAENVENLWKDISKEPNPVFEDSQKEVTEDEENASKGLEKDDEDEEESPEKPQSDLSGIDPVALNNYLRYIDEIVLDGLIKTVAVSFGYFVDHTDSTLTPSPLMEARMLLIESEVIFEPALDFSLPNSFLQLMENLLYEISKQGALMERIKAGAGDNYLADIEADDNLNDMKGNVEERTQFVMNLAYEYTIRFEPHSYLWNEDRKEYLDQFLKYGHVLSSEEIENKFSGEEPPKVHPKLESFKEMIDKFEQLYFEVEKFPNEAVFEKWFRLDMTKFKRALLSTVRKWSTMFKQYLIDSVVGGLSDLEEFIKEAEAGLSQPLKDGDLQALRSVMGWLHKVKEREVETDNMFEPIKEYIELLKIYDYELPDKVYIQLEELPLKWSNLKKLAVQVRHQVAPLQAQEVQRIRRRINEFDKKVQAYRNKFRKKGFFFSNCLFPYNEIDKTHSEIVALEEEYKKICDAALLFEVFVAEPKPLYQCKKEIKLAKNIWDYLFIVNSSIEDWKKSSWKNINVENMDLECKRMAKDVKIMDKDCRSWEIYKKLDSTIRNMISSLKSVAELQDPSIKERHWKELQDATNLRFVTNENATLADFLNLNLHNYEEEVKNIVDKAIKENIMDKTLRDIKATWATQEYDLESHPRTGIKLVKASEELIELLEDHQVQLQNIAMSKYLPYFRSEVEYWQNRLFMADQVLATLNEVQKTWSNLESIFIATEDIRRNLPEESARFDKIDADFKAVLNVILQTMNVCESTNQPGVLEELERIKKELAICEKALTEYLETKRLAFPRFYFVSSVDLLDILSNGNEPKIVQRHLSKLFDSMAKLEFQDDQENQKRKPDGLAGGSGGETETEESDKEKEKEKSKVAKAMFAKDGEKVEMHETYECTGPVEVWLNGLEGHMKITVKHYFEKAVNSYESKPREKWIHEYPAQVALCGTQIWWTTEVNTAFVKLEEGYENPLKDYNRKQANQLSILIGLLLGKLTPQERQKIMTICTIDVHSRDFVAKLVHMKVESSQAFQWQCQLRHRWGEAERDCFANICDAQFRYSYEYLGNQSRLVITPLTDRCYITLSQSLHLKLGGAPAGPAGTGKTETTKDLGRALGMMVYVFNCSEQMDYKSVGNIFKGLCQTGAWGCFDEFNRIAVEVLSVVSVQVKTIQEALRNKKERFVFMGEDIKLVPTVGIFITMNPGYAGRTELPENLKVLFRPCAMVVPDFDLICEIMLVAEGFQEAKVLGKKFITLYTLCRELLSKQDHYDWGLRAIKSVLVVAGHLKRGDPERPEDQVLMRALRDFNLPKIVSDDVPIFLGLIGDLFPAIEVPRKRDHEFEKNIKIASIQLGNQPEDTFVKKIVQLQELIDVRHSIFILGDAGTGKTQIWKTLFKTHQNLKHKPMYNDLNPKAVTTDELFGIINPSTREWKDGILSVLMRDQANSTSEGPKWIILDGDIDPMWIESLNSVMDDNKVLTLASNERIALSKSMRLIFEIYTLRVATPATVSRAGILYINPTDLGYTPYIASWIEKRGNATEKSNLTVLMDKYVPNIIDAIKTNQFKTITPLTEINRVELLCNLLDTLINPENLPHDSPKDLFETYFVFACVWAFGSATFQDQLVDHRVEFSKWWVKEFKFIKFPQEGTVFDYYIDPETKKFLPWTNVIPKFRLDPDLPLQATLVNTAETTRIRYFMDLLIAKSHPVMLVGSSGSGKTVIIGDKLSQLNPEAYSVANIPFNYYTTSEMLQRLLEKPLEKKAGRNYGPIGNKKLIYFIDDMNMAMVDTYGTIQPDTIIRQHMDYHHWYDRGKVTLKEIHNVQYVACMNPTAGSFTINPRLQRHFAVFSVGFPGNDSLQTIYKSILQQHLRNADHRFSSDVIKTEDSLVKAAIELHNKVTSTFLPTATKFHYIFNLRDLSNVFQGILFSSQDCLQSPTDLVRLWMHEASRVYADKLVDQKDNNTFQHLLSDCTKSNFQGLNQSELMEQPLIYFHYAQGLGDAKYMPVTNFDDLTRMLKESLDSYNESNPVMNLVLFDDAIRYICRISRILESPRGNALLVGVGGSGKQSLSRLAAYLSQIDVFQLTLRSGYGIPDLKNDLAQLYIKTGQKNIGTMFLMTDAQVAEERYLVLINDMLASGEILDLLPEDEVENIVAQMRPEVKAIGKDDTRENCWKYFIDRVRKTLKCVLCFSPVGNVLRDRARRFPAIINCTQIVWFHEWPQEALLSVSKRFVRDIEPLPEKLCDSVARFMAFVHSSVNEMSKVYLANEKRYNYATPKSFLEQINLYGKLVTTKNREAFAKADRLESGLSKLESCAEQVHKMKKVLAKQEIVLKEKNEKAEELIKQVAKETEMVNAEKENAAVEEKKVAMTADEVAKIQEVCRIELEKAEPALKAAYAALNTLNKANLTELKSFTTPPPDVVNVCIAVLILWVGTRTGKIQKEKSWKAAKTIMMSDTQKFLDGLLNLEKEKITMQMTYELQPYVKSPGFDPDNIRSKSFAASGLCSYVLNVLKFNDVFQDVAPKRKALHDATEQLNRAKNRLKFLKTRIKELKHRLEVLTREFEIATEAKLKCQAEADKTARVIDLANRLVGGLGAEKVRWIQNVKKYRESTKTIPGDMLLVCAFVSYLGCFTKRYRVELLDKTWIPYLQKIQPSIPMSNTVDPLLILTDDAEIAQWNNFGLPSDRMSSENAAILVNSQRWPLLIDPQLQGIKWIKNMYGTELKVIRLGQKGYLEAIEQSIAGGKIVLIENIKETVDPVLEPLLARNFIKRGTAIKIGDREIDYNKNFRLIFQTKLANPHYKPEMQAQTTLINFTVTRDGLEDQLLAEVVKVERPDLEAQKRHLTKQQNEYKILLKKCEEELLSRLQTAKGNFLDNTSLVENLETTKRTSQEVELRAKESIATSIKIDNARELYRPAASRASLLYFLLNDLYKINPMYQFSLKAFSTVFHNAIKQAPHNPDVQKRVENLIDAITFAIWMYTSRGLFEKDKLIFTSQMAFQIQLQKGSIAPRDLEYLLRYPVTPNVVSPVDFLTNSNWGAVKSLSTREEFKNIDQDIESSSIRWKKIVESETPEREKLPQEWKSKNGVQKLSIMRALRPDRMTYAVSVFIEETLGVKYVKSRRLDFVKSFEESSNSTPIFFILSPGVDPLKEVEDLGRKYGYSEANKNFHNVSLGQGQEVVAEKVLDLAAKKGHWVILQNIHLVARWLPNLEKKLEQNAEKSHKRYRVFISAEPAPAVEFHIIPQGILESSIKITNEPPSGMLANLHKALDLFNEDTLEQSSKEIEFKAILFSLCYFHAVVNERKKFGTQGWNRKYPFNNGDLTISVSVLSNYLEANSKVPWEDLRYLFGEIMYGGHITDDWDRRLCLTYLDEYMHQELLDSEILYAPGFPSPPTTDLYGYHQYVDENLPAESPVLYGLHPNSEIMYLTSTSESLFKTVFELQPRDSVVAGGQVITREEKIKQIIDDITNQLPEPFNMMEIQGKTEERSPYIVVAIQECERMNLLTTEISRSLTELDLGLKGELTMTIDMDDLGNSLFMDQVPPSWTQRAYPSTMALGAWYADLIQRIKELEYWTSDFSLPPAIWLGGLFNPQSFLTAIMQTTARKQELPLDKMCLMCEVSKKSREETRGSPKEGANVCGLFMEGARWDSEACTIVESKLKELYPPMPVIRLKAIPQDKLEMRNIYECPVYKTRLRGPTYVWTFNLRSREKPSKWILGGVALLLQV